MNIFLLLGMCLILSGCAFSYSSSFSFEIGKFKIVNTTEEEKTTDHTMPVENVVSETKVGD